MAIKLKKELKNTGVFCEYHKIGKVSIDDGQITVFIDSFPDEAIRRMGKNNLDSKEFTFKIDNNLKELMNVYKKWVYKKIKESKPVSTKQPDSVNKDGEIIPGEVVAKETNEWNGAEDV